MASKLVIEQVRSKIGRPKAQRLALGWGHLGVGAATGRGEQGVGVAQADREVADASALQRLGAGRKGRARRRYVIH